MLRVWIYFKHKNLLYGGEGGALSAAEERPAVPYPSVYYYPWWVDRAVCYRGNFAACARSDKSSGRHRMVDWVFGIPYQKLYRADDGGSRLDYAALSQYGTKAVCAAAFFFGTRGRKKTFAFWRRV